MEKYDFSPEDANFVNSIVYIISAVASPLFGFVIDKTGRNVFWILLSVLCTITAHAFLAFTHVNPYVCMVSFNCLFCFRFDLKKNMINDFVFCLYFIGFHGFGLFNACK